MSLSNYIKILTKQQDLSQEQSYQAAKQIFNSDNEVQIAAFLTLLSAKGETVDELLGFIQAIKENSKALKLDIKTVDIVGTGGDHASTINISSASALLTAALGVPVVKHGNIAVSSNCGSADVLQALGYSLKLSEEEIATKLKTENFAFCFAPYYHPILAKVKNVRKKLNQATIFNLLGPLLNPAGSKHIVLGVYDQKRVELIAKVLQKLGTVKSIVFSVNGTDELSCISNIEALLVTPDTIEKIQISPLELGLSSCTIEDLVGYDATYNSAEIYRTFSGTHTKLSDTLALNAGVALFIYGVAKDIQEGVNLAKARLAQGGIIKQNKLLEIILRKDYVPSKHKSLKQAILNKSGHAVIAEIKRASPSAGKIATITDPIARAREYVDAGAAAISVLTDAGFEGSLDDLRIVAQAIKDTSAAVLCKDFIINASQIAKAAEAGADAILIMVSVLHNRTAEMVKIAHAFGLETLVEVHNESELPIALASGGDVIGINQRDLRDFSMHPEIFNQLITQIPSNMVKIAESGTKTSADANNAYKLGYDAVLVGEALSRLDDPRKFFAKLGEQNG